LIQREYAQVVKKKSFLVGVVLTPLFMVVIMVLPALLATKKSATTEKLAIIDMDEHEVGEKFKEAIKRYKLDDGSPAYAVTNIYTPNPDDSVEIIKLRQQLDSLIIDKKLKNYIVISQNAENNDSIFIVAKSFGLTTSSRFEKRLSDILSGIRLDKSQVNLDIDSVLFLTRKVELKDRAPGGKERDFMTMYMAGIVFIMIIFMTVIGYGQILMRSVIEEKNSRIIEVMVSSVSPFQLMAGKIIGLGLATLTQVGIWIIVGLGIYSYKGALNINADISGIIFNPVLILFFVLFLILGYILYTTLFALIGSICNTDKEAQNFIFPITMALIMPVIIAMYIIQEPDSVLATTLSLIPFFTPTMMILRLNVAGVETFSLANPIIIEASLGVLITTLTTVLVIWITSKIFRIGILMYGKRPTLPEIIKWVKY
ncbi:MAG: ABC transporter permease, partial [candidate division Zixibacteria bacterium]|nr:ABC transporter permease [candidate division Zixibacteria bacterium]